MGGLAFCRWLRTRPGCRTLPVLVMTAHDDSETIQNAFDAGASDFVAKPLNFNILVHRVRFLLRARDNLRALERSRRNLAEAQGIARLGSWELTPCRITSSGTSQFIDCIAHRWRIAGSRQQPRYEGWWLPGGSLAGIAGLAGHFCGQPAVMDRL